MIYFLLTIFFVLADILSKYIVTSKMSVGMSVPLWQNVFHLTYVRNTGAAFSMLSGLRLFLIVLPIVVIVAIIIYIFVKKPQNRWLLLSFSMIISGGIGNLIDRIRLGYVIDFLDFRLINFPVFNIADIWVTLGAAIFICTLLLSKEDTL